MGVCHLTINKQFVWLPDLSGRVSISVVYRHANRVMKRCVVLIVTSHLRGCANGRIRISRRLRMSG